jgi:hypothetical protein
MFRAAGSISGQNVLVEASSHCVYAQARSINPRT